MSARNKKRYRYYVSGTVSIVEGVESDTPVPRLNARELEEAVIEATAQLLPMSAPLWLCLALMHLRFNAALNKPRVLHRHGGVRARLRYPINC